MDNKKQQIEEEKTNKVAEEDLKKKNIKENLEKLDLLRKNRVKID